MDSAEGNATKRHLRSTQKAAPLVDYKEVPSDEEYKSRNDSKGKRSHRSKTSSQTYPAEKIDKFFSKQVSEPSNSQDYSDSSTNLTKKKKTKGKQNAKQESNLLEVIDNSDNEGTFAEAGQPLKMNSRDADELKLYCKENTTDNASASSQACLKQSEITVTRSTLFEGSNMGNSRTYPKRKTDFSILASTSKATEPIGGSSPELEVVESRSGASSSRIPLLKQQKKSAITWFEGDNSDVDFSSPQNTKGHAQRTYQTRGKSQTTVAQIASKDTMHTQASSSGSVDADQKSSKSCCNCNYCNGSVRLRQEYYEMMFSALNVAVPPSHCGVSSDGEQELKRSKPRRKHVSLGQVFFGMLVSEPKVLGQERKKDTMSPALTPEKPPGSGSKHKGMVLTSSDTSDGECHSKTCKPCEPEANPENQEIFRNAASQMDIFEEPFSHKSKTTDKSLGTGKLSLKRKQGLADKASSQSSEEKDVDYKYSKLPKKYSPLLKGGSDLLNTLRHNNKFSRDYPGTSNGQDCKRGIAALIPTIEHGSETTDSSDCETQIAEEEYTPKKGTISSVGLFDSEGETQTELLQTQIESTEKQPEYGDGALQSPIAKDKGWECEHCTFINQPEAWNCSVCEHKPESLNFNMQDQRDTNTPLKSWFKEKSFDCEAERSALTFCEGYEQAAESVKEDDDILSDDSETSFSDASYCDNDYQQLRFEDNESDKENFPDYSQHFVCNISEDDMDFKSPKPNTLSLGSKVPFTSLCKPSNSGFVDDVEDFTDDETKNTKTSMLWTKGPSQQQNQFIHFWSVRQLQARQYDLDFKAFLVDPNRYHNMKHTFESRRERRTGKAEKAREKRSNKRSARKRKKNGKGEKYNKGFTGKSKPPASFMTKKKPVTSTAPGTRPSHYAPKYTTSTAKPTFSTGRGAPILSKVSSSTRSRHSNDTHAINYYAADDTLMADPEYASVVWETNGGMYTG